MIRNIFKTKEKIVGLTLLDLSKSIKDYLLSSTRPQLNQDELETVNSYLSVRLSQVRLINTDKYGAVLVAHTGSSLFLFDEDLEEKTIKQKRGKLENETA